MAETSGFAQVYSFPFRVYASEPLGKVDVRSPDKRHRFRVHPPLLVREDGPPASPDPPLEKWPDFRRAKGAAWPFKGDELTNIQINPLSGTEPFDAIRVDAWGSTAEKELNGFVNILLEAMRLNTHQAWIGTVEVHTDPNIKYAFPIDVSGGAVEPPMPYGKRCALPPAIRPLSADLWEEAIRYAAAKGEPPTHWSTYLDANIYRALGRTGSAVLALALSMEVARDTVFPRFAPTEEKHGVGEVLADPFQGTTDLLKHLSSLLEEAHPDGRNLKKENADLASDVYKLYVARHHIAHGGKPMYPEEERGMIPVESNTLAKWTESVHHVLVWMDAL